MVDELLGLTFCQYACGKIPLDVDVQEGGDAPHAHGSPVLGLDGRQVAEVEPLHCLPGVFGGPGNVKAVGGRHLLHLSQCPDLFGQFLPLADDVISHGAVAAVVEILLFGLDQKVDAVERHPAVVPHNASPSICVRQPGDDLAVPGLFDLRRVGIEHALVVGRVVLAEKFVEYRVRGVAVGGAGFLRHADAAKGHEGPLQGLVCLQSHHLFLVLQGLAYIAGPVGGDGGDDIGVHVQDAAFRPLLFLELLQLVPEKAGGVSRALQKRGVPLVGRVVVLDEVPDIDLFPPEPSLKTIPLRFLHHMVILLHTLPETRCAAGCPPVQARRAPLGVSHKKTTVRAYFYAQTVGSFHSLYFMWSIPLPSVV